MIEPSKVKDDAGSIPLVSIGVPVYNEDRFLEAALRSLLAQDYKNLEIIISDNASTDKTKDICRKFCKGDNRVRYFRFDTNQGITTNFKRVVELAQGKYFMWASGHDLWSENLVSECTRSLEHEAEAVIAFGTSAWVDATGNPLASTSGWTDTRGMDPVARFFSVFWGNMHPILGVMRVDALRKARYLSCAGTDLITLSELVLMGHFLHVPTTSWIRREFRSTETHQDRMKRYRSSEYALSASVLDRTFPILRLPFELVRSVLRARVTWLVKLGIFAILIPSFPVKYLLGRRGRFVPGSGQMQDLPK